MMPRIQLFKLPTPRNNNNNKLNLHRIPTKTLAALHILLFYINIINQTS